MSYAVATSVPVERSQAEIQRLVSKYGAQGYGVWTQGPRAMVCFEVQGRRVVFILDLPDRSKFARRPHRGSTKPCTPEQQSAMWEQACRSKWRALVLIVKAKLEAIESGVSTFDDEFLPFFALPDGTRLRDKLLPALEAALAGQSLPPLLPGLPAPAPAAAS